VGVWGAKEGAVVLLGMELAREGGRDLGGVVGPEKLEL
jgi:hypothetical protein